MPEHTWPRALARQAASSGAAIGRGRDVAFPFMTSPHLPREEATRSCGDRHRREGDKASKPDDFRLEPAGLLAVVRAR